jgi:hypothetical protein
MHKQLILILFILIGYVTPIKAGLIKQTFHSEWTIEPQDRYGEFVAWTWHYLPYEPWNPTLGQLTEVRVRTQVEGVLFDPTENIRITYGFFTGGWPSADWQLGHTEVLAGEGSSFHLDRSFVFNESHDLQRWAYPAFLPNAAYYFDSRTDNAGHSLQAVTTLEFQYSVIPEPSTLYLCMLGVSAILIRKRRREHAAR